MAGKGDDGTGDRDARIRRGVARTIANWAAVLISLGVIVGWGATGFYQLDPGESAVILRIGEYNRTVNEPGLRWHWPPPLESHEKVAVTEIRREKFGLTSDETPSPGADTATFETAIQTADSNIVNLSYVVQYRVADPFAFLYGMAAPTETLRDAAQAAVREVVGRKPVDAVLSSQRGEIQESARDTLQETLDGYFRGTRFEGRSAFEIDRIVLQIVQPPAPVQDAFDDVIAAQQDADRAVSQAAGDAQEITQRADALANEMLESATAYKEVKVLEARGEATRFEALREEYARAPVVTRRRLYLESLEQILPHVDKWIVEKDVVSLVPMLSRSGPAAPAPPVAAPPPEAKPATPAAPPKPADGAAAEGQR